MCLVVSVFIDVSELIDSSCIEIMATDLFAFTEEDSNDSIPDIFRDTESEEEFDGFTAEDITFGNRVRRFHERRDVDCFVDNHDKENIDPALSRGKKRVLRTDR